MHSIRFPLFLFCFKGILFTCLAKAAANDTVIQYQKKKKNLGSKLSVAYL